MNHIIEIIESCDSFDDLSKTLKDKDFLKTVSIFLRENNINSVTQVFLSAFMIYLYPKDTLGNIGELKEEGFIVQHSPEDDDVFEKAKELVLCCKNLKGDFPKLVDLTKSFEDTFKNWKDKDKETLKQSLINEYHTLTVNIMNAEEDMKESLKQCQSGILDTAKMLGGEDFVNEILQYSPVIIDTEELLKTYSQAFWDLLKQEYLQKQYDKIFVVLEHIVILLCTIRPTAENEIKETIDIEFIKQKLRHDAYSQEEMYNLCQYIMNICKDCQAPQFDQNIEILNAHLKEEHFLPIFLQEISIILQITADDVVKFREQIAEVQRQND